MRFSKKVDVVSLHTGGCVGDVITGGVLDVPGDSVFEKMRYLQTEGDELRRFFNEPRSSSWRPINLLVPASHPEAVAGYVIMLAESYPTMSGSNTICVATTLLETGMVPMQEPITKMTLEAPGGLVNIIAACQNGKVLSVTFENVPSVVLALDKKVEVAGIGTVDVDVAYGGMIYGVVDGAAFGFDIVPDENRELIAIGERVKAAIAEQIPVVHPENALIHTVNQTLFAGPVREEGDEKRSRNAVIVSPGGIDRSACGSGTCARLAIMHAKGQIKVGERLHHESILDTVYVGEVLSSLSVGAAPAIRASITGAAHITGFHQYVLDPTDPIPTGNRLHSK